MKILEFGCMHTNKIVFFSYIGNFYFYCFVFFKNFKEKTGIFNI